eukprot:UN17891
MYFFQSWIFIIEKKKLILNFDFDFRLSKTYRLSKL